MIILYDILHEYKMFTGNANNAKVMGLVFRENTSLVAKMGMVYEKIFKIVSVINLHFKHNSKPLNKFHFFSIPEASLAMFNVIPAHTKC